LDQELVLQQCGAVFVLYVYHKAGLSDFMSNPIAYAGLLGRVFKAKSHELLYQRREFARNVDLSIASFPQNDVRNIAHVLPKFYKDVTGSELPDFWREVSRGEISRVEQLLQSGFEIESIDNNGRTALILAAEQGHWELARFLIERKANFYAADSQGRTALHTARVEEKKEVVTLLELELAHRREGKRSEGLGGVTDKKSLLRLYELNEKLRTASEEGRLGQVKSLLREGALINSADKFGMTALMAASKEGRVDVVRFLLETGADVSAASYRRLIKVLYRRYPYEGKKTALILAAEAGHSGVVKLLLDSHADIAATDMHGESALDLALLKKKPDVVALLKAAGAR
jgi:ankyrin repeat protein